MSQSDQGQIHPRVLVFDSGVGGLSIADPLMQQFPQIAVTYCADNRFFPYGTKSEDAVRERVCSVIRALADQHPCDLVVIACNTASTIALGAVRNFSSVPVVGVVPAVKPAAEGSKTNAIGILATPAAVQSSYTQRLIDDFAKDCRVVLKGSSVLVEMAEQKLRGFQLDMNVLAEELSIFIEPKAGFSPVDSVVLGCTHFPLLRDEMTQICGPTIKFVDSGDAIVRRVGQVLCDQLKTQNFSHQPFHLALFTESTAAVAPLQNSLNLRGFKRIEILNF